MYKNYTIMETRNMSREDLEENIRNSCEFLEKLGMEHTEACRFISSIMNLGIAMEEKNKLNGGCERD